MPTVLTQTGAYPLLGVGQLPNADVASPGEVWSRKRANGVVVPGSLVRPVVVGGVQMVQPVEAGDVIVTSGNGIRIEQLAVALRQIMVPDLNPGSQYNPQLGPNEIVNLPIGDGDYVRQYFTGGFHLSLVKPDSAYEVGDIIGWDPTAARPVGKATGTGAWARLADDTSCVANTGIFEVFDNPRYYGSDNECVLTVRALRSNQ